MSKAPNPHVMNTTTAGPIGLTAFGVTTILLNFLNAELIEKPSITLIICYGMFHGGMIQILAGMWEVYRGNIFACSVHCALSCWHFADVSQNRSLLMCLNTEALLVS
mmetsp:Transcript_29447/g.64714  ORF Transcript_29447/g.64714 Transcript_29447/m.64714 type:complete len:107 (-) Transcript_29447:206-526(-)